MPQWPQKSNNGTSTAAASSAATVIYNDKTKTRTSPNNSSTPVLIIHVGPPKTGSTTLQCTLESLRPELERDGIAYIGRPECQGMDISTELKKEFKLFESAFVTGYDCHRRLVVDAEKNAETSGDGDSRRGENSNAGTTCWDEFLRHLNGYRNESKNVVFSDEAMSNRITLSFGYRPGLPYPWRALESALLGWDVKILIVHRPLYDYLHSVYVEQYKYGPNKVKLRRWFNGGGGESGDNNRCPSQKGRKTPRPFDDDAPPNEVTISRLLDRKQKLYPTPALVYETFRERGYETILVDMMMMSKEGQEGDFISRIICDHLPGTFHACKALSGEHSDTQEKLMEGDQIKLDNNSDAFETKRKTITAMNPSLSLHYDHIAVEACRRGLIDGETISRETAQRAIRERQERELKLAPNDFPLICPDGAILREILSQSLEHERRLRNFTAEGETVRWGPDEESSLEEQFWRTVNDKKKFCAVDSKRVVEDKNWIEFFSTIDK